MRRRTAALFELAGSEPYAPVSLLIRAALRLPQRAVATVTTNVPGPEVPLFILGRPIREVLPYVPIAERMRVGVAVLTYAGQASIGVTTDFASVPEADAFAAAVVDEVAALRAVRQGSRPVRAGAGECGAPTYSRPS